MKNIHARQLTLKNIHATVIQAPPPITFLMVRPLTRLSTDFEQCRKQPQIA